NSSGRGAVTPDKETAVARRFAPSVQWRESSDAENSTSTSKNHSSSAKRAKIIRAPYRCRLCGQVKNNHRCRYKKVSQVETNRSMTTKPIPRTAFKDHGLPVPSVNENSLFCARPY
ncbi:unnamed protein product, partial [Pylaiella littoralis]